VSREGLRDLLFLENLLYLVNQEVQRDLLILENPEVQRDLLFLENPEGRLDP
jgi:hypothetical protein